jgi:hypothetical protein
MKTKRLITGVIIVIMAGLFVSLLLDYAALHDIHKEYVSTNILETLGVELSRDLPAWTENKGEWDYLTVSYLFKSVCYATLFIMAIFICRKEK